MNSNSIIAVDKFIQATRDSGYKGTASAISELVDNSIQAGATRISITIEQAGDDDEVEVSILDNGCGMDPATLRQALRFGGSTRFGDRRGLGRYGMGLPNSSLSQARRLTVYTWRADSSKKGSKNSPVYSSYLDVDEIMAGGVSEVPIPRLVDQPTMEFQSATGTLVVWSKCDRLENRRISTLARKLEDELGRRFRHYIWKGLAVRINGDIVKTRDPLFLNPKSVSSGGTIFGEEQIFEVPINPLKPNVTGLVSVTFSELPVQEWHSLTNEEKRKRGISKGAGVSVVRAGREVDYGWFFMGSKHRENYDDWWRCEIQFDPDLDEAFGITHTKQQIRPAAHLTDALTAELEATARALNGRVRKAHFAAKTTDRYSSAERVAAKREHLLKPLPSKGTPQAKELMKELERRYPTLKQAPGDGSKSTTYRVIEGALKETSFFTFAYDGDRLVLLVNPDHPFYREIYSPLVASGTADDQQFRSKIDLLLLSAARSEAMLKDGAALSRHRHEWSNILATFLND